MITWNVCYVQNLKYLILKLQKYLRYKNKNNLNCVSCYLIFSQTLLMQLCILFSLKTLFIKLIIDMSSYKSHTIFCIINNIYQIT